MKDLAETIEFFVPPEGAVFTDYMGSDDIGALHHLARYEWACRVLAALPAGQRVLDIACGSGYGAAMFAGACSTLEIVGCDYDARGVALAASRHRAPNLRFAQGDMVTWRGDDGELGQFDAITTFDTIEHIAHRDLALLNLARHLTDEGALLLSTPCAHEATVLRPDWEHHKVEYSHRDLVPLMRRFFRDVRQPSDDGFPHAAFWETEVNGGAQRYPNIGNPLYCRGPIR